VRKNKTEIIASEYALMFGISDCIARRDLANLIIKGLLLKEGDWKVTKYRYVR
jgi:ATP-dependent DNA helicase RecG